MGLSKIEIQTKRLLNRIYHGGLGQMPSTRVLPARFRVYHRVDRLAVHGRRAPNPTPVGRDKLVAYGGKGFHETFYD